MENPLQGYYRTKDIYVKLPTKGRWMKSPPKLSQDGEIGVRAMNVRDELLLNIPDALYNGQSIFELIESICPDITDASDMSLPDVDVVMLASRATSYEKTYPVEATCPHCENSQMFDIDLQKVLGQIVSVTDQVEIEVDGLVVEMKPNTLSAVNANNIVTSETGRILQGIRADKQDITEDLRGRYSENIQQIAAANLVLVADAIVKVTMPDGQIVSENQHIIDWLSNSNRRTIEILSGQQFKLNSNGIPKEFKFTCGIEDCQKGFSSLVEFNPSFFFTTPSVEGKPAMR
tara:strand:- start:260 stop:1126 length:867 start_codon:yes stop_codon:yes gene_type:complete